MGLESDFHEMFHVPEPSVVNKKPRNAGPVNDRQRLRQAARGRGLRLEQLHMQQQFNAIQAAAVGIRQLQDRPAKAPSTAQTTSKSALTDSITSQPGPPYIELNCNPSSFSVYSAVRQSVLEAKLRKATLLYNQSIQGLIDESLEDNEEDKNKISQALKVCRHSVLSKSSHTK